MSENIEAPVADADRGPVRRLYDAMLQVAESRYALWALAGLCFLQSIILPVPPDLLLIPMVLARRTRAWLFAGVATLSSVGGGVTGYVIGYFLYDMLGQHLLALWGHEDNLGTFEMYRDTWGVWIVAAGALTPFPYKLVAIASGVARLDAVSFVLASLVARGMRFYVEAALLWYLGPTARRLIEQRLGATLLIGLVVITIAAVVLIPFLT